MPDKSKEIREISVDKAYKLLESCAICPRKCKVNRLRGELGFCRTGLNPKVFSFMPHHGEEPPISGENGSGTIFFSNCNMSCLYCQNFQFSQMGEGKELSVEELSGIMLKLQKAGCHNINLVTPTHVMPQILKALSIAFSKGLWLPICYNTSGYELPEIIRMLDGIIDIYLADMRYADEGAAEKYSAAPGYPFFSKASIKEMYSQVPVAKFDEKGIMKQGLIIRHLVLPNGISGTREIMEFIARELSTDAYISLMSQYLPCHKAAGFKEISRRITPAEYESAQRDMESSGLHNGWTQESLGLERFAGTNIKRNL